MYRPGDPGESITSIAVSNLLLYPLFNYIENLLHDGIPVPSFYIYLIKLGLLNLTPSLA
jgi:hypothetical protein